MKPSSNRSVYVYDSPVNAINAFNTLVALDGLGDTKMSEESRMQGAFGVICFAFYCHNRMTDEDSLQDCQIIYQDLSGYPTAILRAGSWENTLYEVTIDRLFIGALESPVKHVGVYYGKVVAALESVRALTHFLEMKRTDGSIGLHQSGIRVLDRLLVILQKSNMSKAIEQSFSKVVPFPSITVQWLSVGRLHLLRGLFIEAGREQAFKELGEVLRGGFLVDQQFSIGESEEKGNLVIFIEGVGTFDLSEFKFKVGDGRSQNNDTVAYKPAIYKLSGSHHGGCLIM